MKLAMPTNTDSMEGRVNNTFGRSPYFLIYDTETKEGTFFNNPAAASHGGAGIKAAQVIVDKNIDALITPRCGENAANVLNQANIKIYQSLNDTIRNNISACQEGELSTLENIHAGFHHHGGR
ncbi:NifB/NifX family molybdenum-iron cluster-binding protein [Clostridium sp. D2Q-11]|uniref:NifB/NifX family molybdenum-iron cluster-binding protein n=1 Tax=Anaeromonas frigoriresistens TaxID=2683708 RepID=A0A942UTD1_9FIRM|nr:NifB/NifX family molybdenum-iron cluster-binding protein [Anaeromonas frigoriresistens]MBS4538788.1 NifB/NifX family molybdenum-iron cluster-binding protein [Anaeromonas frigoriresistens]